MNQIDDLSGSLTEFDQESTLVGVIELGNASWLVAGTLPGVALLIALWRSVTIGEVPAGLVLRPVS